ncbi:MAG: hypothetical protein JW900_07900 [Anaerolineae bacterium]|nr:hypothetical protein [Anaerolineae bacterium]
MKTRIVILSGERGVGKTTVCRKTIARARDAGLTCGGILTVRAESGARIAVDVRSGAERRLTTSAAGVRQGRYTFDPAVLAWGSRLLAQALPCDLFVVDEIGPLEIRRGEGWRNALDLLHGERFRLALAVVRPALVTDVQFLLPTSATVLKATPENRNQLPEIIAGMIEE